MIRLFFNEPLDANWVSWREECKEETEKFIHAVANGNTEQYKVRDLYKNKTIKKKYYFNDDFTGPFWRKCAYCEESIASQDGDVEHFRPKRRVSDNNREVVNGHNGYYWLAYDWKNLLPCCLKCNQLKIWDKAEGKFWIGKQDRFPLEDGSPRVFSHTEDLAIERPLLINPLIEEPEDHLSVETSTGIMKWQTIRGRACIDMFGLNVRDDLRDGRKAAIKSVKSLVSDLLTYLENEDKANIRSSIEELMKYVRGEKRFSLAARCYLKAVFEDTYQVKLENMLKKHLAK